MARLHQRPKGRDTKDGSSCTVLSYYRTEEEQRVQQFTLVERKLSLRERDQFRTMLRTIQ